MMQQRRALGSWVLATLLCSTGCNLDKMDRSAVNKIAQVPFNRERWRLAKPDDAYRGRVRYAMYKDVMKRSKPGMTMTEVLAEYGPPTVVMTTDVGFGDPFGRRERPAGTEYAVTYFLAQDREANFGLNLTFCFDKSERLIKTVEHW